MCIWTADERKAERKVFYNALALEKVLDYSDLNAQKQYIEHLHGSSNALERLFDAIEMSDTQGLFLFSGQTGSGKSTELLRLKYQLTTADTQSRVFYLDLNDYLNPSVPIDIASFMLAVLAAWLEQLDENPKLSLYSRLVAYLKTTDVELTELNIQGLKLSLRSDTVFLDRLNSAIRQRRTGFSTWLNEYVQAIYAQICPNQEKCILLIDSLEKVTGGFNNRREVHDSVFALFNQHGNDLLLPLVHTVYSIPHMVLGLNNQLPGNLGGSVAVNLPSVHVFKKNTNDADADILDKMRQMVAMRFPNYQQFIDDRVVLHLAEKSGGKLRQFMQAVRHCLTNSSVLTAPITDIEGDEVHSALAQIKPTTVIKKEIWEWLAKVDQSHTAELNGNIDAFVLNEYLDSQHVLVYLNGTAWYGVHPLLRDDLDAFEARQTIQTA
jgi:hypothetical protein